MRNPRTYAMAIAMAVGLYACGSTEKHVASVQGSEPVGITIMARTPTFKHAWSASPGNLDKRYLERLKPHANIQGIELTLVNEEHNTPTSNIPYKFKLDDMGYNGMIHKGEADSLDIVTGHFRDGREERYKNGPVFDALHTKYMESIRAYKELDHIAALKIE